MDESSLQQLKPWLLQQLSLLVDNDTDVLCEYVLALLRHDLPMNELQTMCIDQLKDFLQENTEPFVASLMQAVSSLSQEFPGQQEFRRTFRNREQYDFMQQDTGQGSNEVAGPAPTHQGYIARPGRGRGAGSRARGGKVHNQNRRHGAMSNLSSKQAGPEYAANKKLIVEKIPDDKFNSESLTEYFSQFGTLTNVTLNEQQRLAELEFASHEEASAAWKSPAPIFDNRFVKVFWRKLDSDQPAVDMEAIKKIQEEKQKIFEERMSKKKAHEEKLQKLIDLKSKIIEERERLQAALPPSSSEELASKLSGTEALKQQLAALKQEAANLGITAYGPSQRGGRGGSYHPYSTRGSTRGGRGAYGGPPNMARFNLDLRPKSVQIGPVSPDKRESLTSYLISLGGDFDEIHQGPQSPSDLVIDFKTRRSAERFFFGPSAIPDIGEVSKTWIRKDQAPPTDTPEVNQDSSSAVNAMETSN